MSLFMMLFLKDTAELIDGSRTRITGSSSAVRTVRTPACCEQPIVTRRIVDSPLRCEDVERGGLDGLDAL